MENKDSFGIKLPEDNSYKLTCAKTIGESINGIVPRMVVNLSPELGIPKTEPLKLEINGKYYQPISKEAYKHLYNSDIFDSVYFKMFESLTSLKGETYTRKLDKNINLIEEFKLIQNKQSSLSKWERDEVVRVFYTHYKEI